MKFLIQTYQLLILHPVIHIEEMYIDLPKEKLKLQKQNEELIKINLCCIKFGHGNIDIKSIIFILINTCRMNHMKKSADNIKDGCYCSKTVFIHILFFRIYNSTKLKRRNPINRAQL